MKRILSLLASGALAASGLSVVPAAASEGPPAVPAVVNIEDPAGDANYLNDQGLLTEFQGDNVGPADAGSLSDILKVWFTSDADRVNAHVQTEAAVNGNNVAIFFRVQADPGGVGETCLWFQGGTTGHNNVVGPVASIRDLCGDNDETLTEGAEFKMEEGPDGTGLFTISIPRSLHSALDEGAALMTPKAESRNYTSTPVRSVTAPQVDNTKPGTDFVVTSGEPVAKPTPPGKNDPPGKKKGCAKGKGKKRGCEGKGKKAPKPGKPSATCASFTPGEKGKDAETVVLTDAATEEKPLENPFEFGSAIPFQSSDTKLLNVQVDTDNKDAGLYAYIEFTPRNDYDLNLMHPDGSYAAQSHALNPLIEINEVEVPQLGKISTTGHGGESTDRSEKLVGIRTSDCGGWTLDVTNWAGPGEEVTLQLWLGDVANEPLAEGEQT